MSTTASSSRRSQNHSSRVSATPSRTQTSSRHHNNSNSNNDKHRPPTPEYEPLSTPLNATGQRALASLLSSPCFQQMKKHLGQASDKITEVAAEVNERATDSRVRFENSRTKKRGARNKKKKKKGVVEVGKRENGDGSDDEKKEDEEEKEVEEDEDEDEDEEEEEEEEEEDEVDLSRARKLEQLEGKVKEVTVQLEEKMRGIVDGESKLSAMQELVEDVQKEAEQAGAEAHARERQSRLRNRRNRDFDEDEEMEDPDEEEDLEETVTVVPNQIMNDKLNEFDAQWEEQSLAQRYAQNNNYVGFYRIVHDSKYPGDEIPPVPHPSTWFSHLESSTAADGSASPVPGRIRDDQSPDDEDEEVAIERERISLKCPLTFSTFVDPVKSTKCVHSFERQAIEDLIRNSSMTIAAGDQDFQSGGRGARARRVRAVHCPVCSVALTLNDLKRDPVLLRRVLRAKAAEQREEEEAQFEGRHHRHRKGGRKSGFTVASDDDDDDDDQVSIDDDDDENEDEDEQEAARNRIRVKSERSRFSSRAPHGVDEIEDD